MSVTKRPISGHGLVAEGAAFSKIGFRARWNTVAGPGHALCACGVVSDESYPTAAARKRWHRGHKFDVLTSDANRATAQPPRPPTPRARREVGTVASEQCRYLAAAYPTLDAIDTCSEHRHDEPTFALARAMAEAFQQPDPTDEQIGWCMDDAAAVVDDFNPPPASWTVTEPEVTDEAGLDFTLTVNGREYVVQPSEWEPSHPVSRTRWQEWEDEDCAHDWTLHPESDTRTCEICGATR